MAHVYIISFKILSSTAALSLANCRGSVKDDLLDMGKGLGENILVKRMVWRTSEGREKKSLGFGLGGMRWEKWWVPNVDMADS